MNSGVIILEGNGELITNESKLVDIFNDFYINIMETVVGSQPTNLANPSDPSRDRDSFHEILSVNKENH